MEATLNPSAILKERFTRYQYVGLCLRIRPEMHVSFLYGEDKRRHGRELISNLSFSCRK